MSALIYQYRLGLSRRCNGTGSGRQAVITLFFTEYYQDFPKCSCVTLRDEMAASLSSNFCMIFMYGSIKNSSLRLHQARDVNNRL